MHLHCATLQNSEASVDDVCKAGVQLMVAIYGGKPGDSLECLLYAAYCSTSLSRRFQAERLPPLKVQHDCMPCVCICRLWSGVR